MSKQKLLQTVFMLSSVLLGACGHKKVEVPVTETATVKVEERKLTDKQKIEMLRTEAHKRGMRWRIICASDSDSDPRYNFLAEAELNTRTPYFILYAEDGAQNLWTSFGDTQANAAYGLLQSIKENAMPTYQAMHKPTAYKREKMCPPELRGQ